MVTRDAVCKRPKGFACRRPDGQSRWIWNLRGVERVLYRLPEVLAAVGGGELIFVVEGEKDVDALAGLGLAATTNPGGAGKWRACYREPLRGARIVVIPDRDAASVAHAESVANALRGVAGEVRILELEGLAAKGDASDWIELRRREGKADTVVARELLSLAGAAPSWERRTAAADLPSLRSTRMSDVQPQAVSFLWRPYLPVGKAPHGGPLTLGRWLLVRRNPERKRRAAEGHDGRIATGIAAAGWQRARSSRKRGRLELAKSHCGGRSPGKAWAYRKWASGMKRSGSGEFLQHAAERILGPEVTFAHLSITQ